ncbi:MAG: hypothetical protein U5K27_07505 [Desulfotignum sp.]|nr:hypothetical protein [Desulfotignum sp.]
MEEHIDIKNIAEHYAKVNAFEEEQNRYTKQIDELEMNTKIKQTKHTKKKETLKKRLPLWKIKNRYLTRN